MRRPVVGVWLAVSITSAGTRGPVLHAQGAPQANAPQANASQTSASPASAPAAPAKPGPPAAASPEPSPPSNAAPQGQPPPPPPQPEVYTYNPDGRRDPFTSLIGTGGEVRSTAGRRVEGPATMAVSDISVRGVLQSRGSLLAMIQGPDNKTYLVHAGDKLLDGTIKSVTPQGLIIIQDVNDPLSLVKQREVSKLLRSLEVVKP